MSAETSAQPTTTGRRPGVGECRFCGSTPAVETAQQSLGSVAVFYRVTTWKGWMCRSCGEAIHREATARTMTWSWWGIGIIAWWIFPLVNRARVRKVRELDVPRPAPGVVAELEAPMGPGPWWYQRRGTLAVTCLALSAVVAFCALIVIGIVGEA